MGFYIENKESSKWEDLGGNEHNKFVRTIPPQNLLFYTEKKVVWLSTDYHIYGHEQDSYSPTDIEFNSCMLKSDDKKLAYVFLNEAKFLDNNFDIENDDSRGEAEIEEYAMVVEDIIDDLENDNIFKTLFEKSFSNLTLKEYQHLLCRYSSRECPINFLNLTTPELTAFEYAVKDYLLEDNAHRTANYDILLHIILTALNNYTIVYTP